MVDVRDVREKEKGTATFSSVSLRIFQAQTADAHETSSRSRFADSHLDSFRAGMATRLRMNGPFDREMSHKYGDSNVSET